MAYAYLNLANGLDNAGGVKLNAVTDGGDARNGWLLAEKLTLLNVVLQH